MSELPVTPAAPSRDPSLQAKKYALLLLEPFLTPEVQAYLKDQSPKNLEAAKDIITSPLFQTAFTEAMAYTKGEKHLDPWLGFLPDSSEFPVTADSEPKPYVKRPRGAPAGNNNALKHGFYARRLPSSHLAGLESTDVDNLKDEITVLRIFIRRVVDLGGEVEDLGVAVNLLRIISFATMGINRLVRTQASLLTRPEDPYSAEIRRKFEQIREELEED
jgi:hypothetical protein